MTCHLTGASEAFIRCQEVERAGSREGFLGGHCWHESPEKDRTYWGTPFFKLPPKFYDGDDYPLIYKFICEKHEKKASLNAVD